MDNNTIQTPLWMRAGAEFVGSFILMFTLYSSAIITSTLYGANILVTMLVTMLAYFSVTLMFGKGIRVQLNPAVTVTTIITNKTKLVDGVFFIAMQTLAGVISALTLGKLVPANDTVPLSNWLSYSYNGYGDASLSSSSLSQAKLSFGFGITAIMETIASIVIIAVILRAFSDNVSKYALKESAAYGFGTGLTFVISGAALNPARATGAAVLALANGSETPSQQLWMFWVFPILAAAIVGIAYLLGDVVKSNSYSGIDSYRESVENYDKSSVTDNGEADNTDEDGNSDILVEEAFVEVPADNESEHPDVSDESVDDKHASSADNTSEHTNDDESNSDDEDDDSSDDIEIKSDNHETDDVPEYSYHTEWSDENKEYVGLCDEFPSLSWLDSNKDDAIKGIKRVVIEVVTDMRKSGEDIPTPHSSAHEEGDDSDSDVVNDSDEAESKESTSSDDHDAVDDKVNESKESSPESVDTDDGKTDSSKPETGTK